MATWQPDPGETCMARVPGSFATGVATPVAGMRWFRDTERNDIQNELPGWPEGPTFTRRTKGDSQVRAAGGFGLRALVALIMGAIAGGVGDISHQPGRVEDRENEVDDFPVMWAGPGSLARTLPWQLDPGRCPADYRTHIIITDRRLLVVGFADDDTTEDELLWETKRSDIAEVERRTYSRVGAEVKITFNDGSWCRFAPPTLNEYWALVRYLVYPTELLAPERLTPGLRQAVQDLSAEYSAPGAAVVTRRSSGNFTVEVVDEGPPDPINGMNTHFRLMRPDGESANPQTGDL